MKKKMDVWTAIAKTMASEGVRYIFGYPGAGRFYHHGDATPPELSLVLCRDESAASFMAMGYAMATGKLGVCYGTRGPGVANMVPGILEAEAACVPLIAIGSSVGETGRGMGAFQEVDQISLLKSITKWTERINQPIRVPWVLRRAVCIALSGRPGPVYIDIPVDIGEAESEMPEYQPLPYSYPLRSTGSPEDVCAAADLLIQSRKPTLVAGGGTLLSKAFDEVQELAELLSIPVMTTPSGRGILAEDHPLAFGQVGLYFCEIGEELYRNSDLLLIIGSQNEDFQTLQHSCFPEGAKYIQVDIDPHEIGKNWVPDVPIVGDAKLVLGDLMRSVRERIGKRAPNAGEDRKNRMKELQEAKQSFENRINHECLEDTSIPIKTKRVIKELNEVFGKDTILVNENGSQDLWSYYFPYYKVLDRNCNIAPGEQTCMGFGVAAAIGVKLARPEMKVVCTTGDGAFQMHMKELATSAQYNAPVTYVVLNNSCAGWGKDKRLSPVLDFKVSPDYKKIAEANQCYGATVKDPSEIKEALERALKANAEGKTAVIDFDVGNDPDDWEFAPAFSEFKALEHSRIDLFKQRIYRD